MLVLALSDEGRSIMTKEIAEKQNLPATYLEQLMLALRKAKLVLATRGAHGGYVLSRSAEDISLAEIVEALEGPLDIADCADVPSCCVDSDACALKEVFVAANKALYDAFDRVSLADLAEKQRAKEGAAAGMYFI
jgi:Rrf2 family protein